VEVYVAPHYRPRYWLHALLLLATVLTTLIIGARMEFNFDYNLAPFRAGDEFIPFFPVEWIWAHPSRLALGTPFSLTLLSILMAHEMGHYVLCGKYRVLATLPFFIPAPTLIGTLGAVIRIKSAIPSRKALFDIGIAGPIAGFVVAVPVMLVALALSKPLPAGLPPSDIRLGFPLIFRLGQSIIAQVAPGSHIAALPLDRIYLHPMAVAAWVGMFATALNLLPSGQLDGGHIVYALRPRLHRYVSWMTVLLLIYLGRHYIGWRVWAALVAAMNVLTWKQRQAPEYPPVGGARRWLAAAAALMLILTLTPIPFTITAG
jgi:membrane-associated protease RseP (regulator of RpoE activity)